MIKAIIFDLDDTLYNEKEFVKSGFKAAAKYISSNFGLDSKKVFNHLSDQFDRGLRGNNFDDLLEKWNLPNTEVENLVNIYRKHKPEIHLYPDAEVALIEIKGHFLLGLITEGWLETQKNKIAALNLTEYFDEIIITGTLGIDNRKLSEKPFQMMLDKLGVKATEAVYIGDNPLKDFIAPKKLGLFTVRVQRGSGQYDLIRADEKHEADCTISELVPLKAILEATEAEHQCSHRHNEKNN